MQPWFCPLATNTKRHPSDVCCKTKSVFVLLLMASMTSSQRWSHPLPIKHCTMTQRSNQQSPRAPHYYSISLTFCYGPRCCQLLHPSCSPPSEAARISHLRYLRGSGEPHCSKVPSLWWMCECPSLSLVTVFPSHTIFFLQLTTQYCVSIHEHHVVIDPSHDTHTQSPECQKSHWPSHKTICQHTAAQLSGVKQQPISAAYPDENLAKYLRRFTSTHASLLGWAGFQALQLKRIPANIRQSALLIELSYNPHGESLFRYVSSCCPCITRAHPFSNRFSIAGTRIVPRSYVTSHDPLVAADIDRREERCRKSGGIGTLVILVQCGGISQVMPVEVDPPSKITWDSRDDWAEVLRHFVESGRTDFKPISTTARG